MTIKQIPVHQLEVIVYVDVVCPKHKEGWTLKTMPVTECPYYLSFKHNDEQIFQKHMNTWRKRSDSFGWRDYPYSRFMKLVADLKADGGYRDEKAIEKMRVYRGTRALQDGHHRAAILCYFFPDTVVAVREVDEALPNDVNDCSNPCSP